MKAQVNLSQVLQGGLAALVGWLFKTVNDLQQEVTALQVEVINSNSKLSDVLNIIQNIDSEITEIIWKIGG
jgi:CII-binding regulator of phage lambda lysogenization HflD